jgi:hypothetical protein
MLQFDIPKKHIPLKSECVKHIQERNSYVLQIHKIYDTMSDLQKLVDYLVDRNIVYSNEPLQQYVLFDQSFIDNEFIHGAEGNTIYSAVSNPYLITVVLATNQSLWYKEVAGEFIFYVKKVSELLGVVTEEFHELNSDSGLSTSLTFTTLDDTSDLTEVLLSYSRFEYNTSNNRLYLSFEELPEVVFDGTQENFYYKRASLEELEDGNYDINYKDSLGLFDDFWDNLARTGPEVTLNRRQRKVKLEFNKTITEGRVFKFPTISHLSTTAGKVTLDYNFHGDDPIVTPKFINTNYAFRLEFHSFQAFFSFCNQVYFSKGEEFDLEVYPKVERYFYAKYHQIVSYLIDNANRDYFRKTDKLVDIIWYLPQTYLQSNIRYLPLLWDLMIAIIEEDDVDNRGLNKEDLIVKILVNISQMLSPDDFLFMFTLTLVNGKDTPFLKLFEELNTDDFRTFVTVFWRVWSQSSYASFDPKENPVISEKEEEALPLVLPYKSDSTIGFYHTNGTIKFSTNNPSTLDVTLRVDSGKTRTVTSSGGYPYEQKIFEDIYYNYPVFHPIAIFNENIPKFLYDKSEGQQFTVLPAFVLLANEESAFWKNIQTGGEYLIDAITTLSGVGNLAKFRHLSKLAKLGHKLTLVQKAKKAVRGLSAIAEISSGTINTLLKLTGINDTAFGRAISEALFYLELVALGGEITEFIGKKLTKITREVLEHPNLDRYLNKIEIDLPNGKKRKLTAKEKSQLKKELDQFDSWGGSYGNSIIASSDPVKVKQFEEGLKRLEKLNLKANPEKAIDYLEDAMPYFNHEVVDGKIVQISKTNCGNTVEVLRNFIRNGVLDPAAKSGLQSTEDVAAKFGFGSFQESKLIRMNEILEEGQEIVIYGVKQKIPVRGYRGETKFKKFGHYFYAIKREGRLHFFDPQTGEVVIFANTTKFDNFYKRGYEHGFEYLTVKN